MAWFHITDPTGNAIVDSGRIIATLPDGKFRVAFKDADGVEGGIRVIDPAELEPCRLQRFDSWSAWRAAA
jgi:hypothetical protein